VFVVPYQRPPSPSIYLSNKLSSHSLELELINDNFLTVRVQVLINSAHHFIEHLFGQVCSQVVVHLPHLLVVGVVVLLQPLVPVLARRFDVGLHSLVNVDSPLSPDESCFQRVYSSSYLYSFSSFGLRGQGCGEVFWALKWVLIGLSDRHTCSAHVLSCCC